MRCIKSNDIWLFEWLCKLLIPSCRILSVSKKEKATKIIQRFIKSKQLKVKQDYAATVIQDFLNQIYINKQKQQNIMQCQLYKHL